MNLTISSDIFIILINIFIISILIVDMYITTPKNSDKNKYSLNSSSNLYIKTLAKLLKNVSYEEILEAATAGAKVLHNRSVGVGRIYNMPITVKNTCNNTEGTRVTSIKYDDKGTLMENYGAKIITKNDDVSKISIIGDSLISYPEHFNKIFELAIENDIQILMMSFSETAINFVVKKDVGEVFTNILHKYLIDNK